MQLFYIFFRSYFAKIISASLFIAITALEASEIVPIIAISQPPSSTSNKSAKLNQNNDHGFWLTQDIKTNLSNNWILQLHTEQRWGSDYKLCWFQIYTGILHYDLTHNLKSHFNRNSSIKIKSFTIGLGISQITFIQKNILGIEKWAWVSRPLIETNLNLVWNDCELNQRLRVEYFAYNSPHYKNFADTRYRLILYGPWKFTSLNIKPFINNEWFFRANTHTKTNPHGVVGVFYEDRFRVGLTTYLLEDCLDSAVWWQWRPIKVISNMHVIWINTYQWGLSVNLIF